MSEKVISSPLFSLGLVVCFLVWFGFFWEGWVSFVFFFFRCNVEQELKMYVFY